MAPSAQAAARRSTARAQPRAVPADSRRAPLKLFEPGSRRRTGTRRFHRSSMWLSCFLVVGSLSAVVVGDTLMAEGQVTLSTTQQEVAVAEATQKSAQVTVAEMAAPPVVVSQAKAQGLVIPTQVIELPQVPLNVPLPNPRTSPVTAVHAARTATSGAPAPR
jgi:hypothetical protein